MYTHNKRKMLGRHIGTTKKSVDWKDTRWCLSLHFLKANTKVYLVSDSRCVLKEVPLVEQRVKDDVTIIIML